jgi:PAS domain S-box-containing protein
MNSAKAKRKQSKGEVSANSKGNYGEVLRRSNVGIYKVTPGDKGRFVDVNPAFVKILGYGSKKELMNLPVCDIYADPAQRKGFSRKMTDNGFVKNEELHLEKKDGTPIIAIDTGITVYDTDGQAVYFEGILEDVTERKRIGEALQKSEELYRKLIETSPDAITMTDLNGTVIMANQHAVEVHGCKNINELLGKNSFEMIAPQDRERALVNAKKTVEEGEVKNVDYTLIRKDGSSFDAEISASVIKDSEGNPKAFIGIIRDITERKRIQNVLRESEEKYRNLVETSPDSITLNDMNGKITMANKAAVRMRGYDSEEELLGKDIM